MTKMEKKNIVSKRINSFHTHFYVMIRFHESTKPNLNYRLNKFYSNYFKDNIIRYLSP